MIKKILILSILISGLVINLLPALVNAQSDGDTDATSGTDATINKGIGNNDDFNIPATGLDPIIIKDKPVLTNQGNNNLSTPLESNKDAPKILVLPDPLNLNADISKAPGQLVIRITNIFLGLIGIAALIIIIYGGSLYLFSMGDTKKTEKGKKVLEYAIIGLAIILGAYIIINTALSVLTQVTK